MIVGFAIGVPVVKAFCNSQCSGGCAFAGFDLACNCRVALDENFQCANIDSCEHAINETDTVTVGQMCNCELSYFDSSIECNIAACPSGYSPNADNSACVAIKP